MPTPTTASFNVETIETPALGDRSYLVHDGKVALVVDPQRDIDRILDLAERLGARITHIVETHVHNDYVSGGLALARATGALHVHADAEGLAFEHQPVIGGSSFDVGSFQVEVVATPGHTPHHLSYVVRGAGRPPAAFTGGSLLYGTVGRTDLVDGIDPREATRSQYHSVRQLADLLPDGATIHPTHGFGSFCASTQSESESDGSMQTEREVNVALTTDDEDTFVDRILSGLTAHPAYYAHMDPLNRAGAWPIDLSTPAPVDAAELGRRLHRGEWVVDLRGRRLFAADHVRGTINIELNDSFLTYLGWLIPWGIGLTLLAPTSEEITEAQRQLALIGIDRPRGAAAGRPNTWGDDRNNYPVTTFDHLDTYDGTVLDVRRPDERSTGAIDGSVHLPLDELLDSLDELPPGRLLVHCASGFRASIAASLLARAGRDVVLIDDSFDRERQ